MPKRQVEDMSGFCRFGDGHRHCSWGQGIETPTAIVVCICGCHTQAVQSTDARPTKVLVPKK